MENEMNDISLKFLHQQGELVFLHAMVAALYQTVSPALRESLGSAIATEIQAARIAMTHMSDPEVLNSFEQHVENLQGGRYNPLDK